KRGWSEAIAFITTGSKLKAAQRLEEGSDVFSSEHGVETMEVRRSIVMAHSLPPDAAETHEKLPYLSRLESTYWAKDIPDVIAAKRKPKINIPIFLFNRLIFYPSSLLT